MKCALAAQLACNFLDAEQFAALVFQMYGPLNKTPHHQMLEAVTTAHHASSGPVMVPSATTGKCTKITLTASRVET